MNIQAGNKYITKHWYRYRYQVVTVKAIFSSLVICDVYTIGDTIGDNTVSEESIPLGKMTEEYYRDYSDELYQRGMFVNTAQDDVRGINSFDAEELWAKGYRKVLE